LITSSSFSAPIAVSNLRTVKVAITQSPFLRSYLFLEFPHQRAIHGIEEQLWLFLAGLPYQIYGLELTHVRYKSKYNSYCDLNLHLGLMPLILQFN